MKKKAGLWVDHKECLIVLLGADTDDAPDTKRIPSNIEFPGQAQSNPAPSNHRDRQFLVHLERYYDNVISQLRDVDSLLIMGPGEAKLEFRKRLAHSGCRATLVDVETVGKMTDKQIISKVRKHYTP